jgi:putative SOS response-associated peptidase YedK
MCFTININLTRNALESRFGAKFRDPGSFRPGYYYNAFEIPELPVIQSEDPESISLVKWGLIPFWVKDSKAASEIRLKTFNARAETIREKPSFRGPVKNKRCLILCRGFYEWQHRGNEKIPHYIYLDGEPPMALAGLYDNWTDRETGEMTQTCSVITTAANPMMEMIHNSKKRMPVILPESSENSWIDPGLSAEEALEFLEPVAESEMRAHTISKLISKRGVEKNVPELVQPYSYDNGSLL